MMYLSYAMTGQPDKGIPRATRIAKKLRNNGYKVVVPHEIQHGAGTHENTEYTHADYIREDIKLGLSRCDMICLVDGWVHSRGCQDEFNYARMMGMRILQVIEKEFPDGFLYVSLLPIDGLGGW